MGEVFVAQGLQGTGTRRGLLLAGPGREGEMGGVLDSLLDCPLLKHPDGHVRASINTASDQVAFAS
jgi:hypothetical protein